jgi:hypothetical protein
MMPHLQQVDRSNVFGLHAEEMIDIVLTAVKEKIRQYARNISLKHTKCFTGFFLQYRIFTEQN